MSTLFGNNISQTYQGLLKLTDSTSGLTSTLQTVESGDGTDSPLQISQTQVNISGSLTINGNPVTNVNTGSFVTTSSFNAYTSSIDTRIDGIEAKTGSYATTGSNTFIGSQIIEGNVTFPSNSFVSSDNVSGALYISSLNQGTLYINADGGEGNVNIGHNGWTGKLNVTGSLGVTNIQGTGSLFLQPNQSDARLVEIYNTSPTDTHITASGGQIFLGDDQTYVKVDNYGSVERIDIVAGNELVVSSSVTNLTGSLHQSGTFYPDQVDWINSSIQLGTGSYILTTDVSGVTQYDTYQNVASALQPFINTGSFNRDGLINTGSLGGSQSITGSLNVQGTLTATSASITYLETVYETASIIYSSGSNQLGDASNDTQTLWGTVNLPSGPLNVTGSTNLSGQLQVQGNSFASFDYNFLNSQIQMNATGSGGKIVLKSENVSISSSVATTITGSLIVNGGITGSYDKTGLITTGSAASTQSITGSVILSGSAGPELDVKGDQLNTGSLTVRSGSLFTISNNTTFNTDLYLTSSLGGQSNIIKGWNDNPSTAGVGSNQANYTGSLRITGSNNTLSLPQIRATGLQGGADMTGYISGSDNIIASNFAGIYLNTGSLLFPKTTNNYVGNNSSILMNFTTSSLAGGHPLIQNNTLYAGQIVMNSNSGSINTTGNLLNGGVITSTQNFVTNVRPSIGTNVVVGNSVTLNHISSSIQYNSNINNAGVTVTNALSSSIVNNVLSLGNNTFLGSLGGSHLIFVSGSQSTNVARLINNNLIGGVGNIISSSFIASSNSNLNSSIIYGNNLAVSASHTAGTFGGSAFLGRFNDTGSLADTQNIVFAVGTGTGTGTRRTGLWIDQGSITNVSGALNLTGSLNVSGSNVTTKLNGNTSINGVTNVLTVTGSATIQHSIAGQNTLTVINGTGLSQPGLEVQGTTTLLGNTLISGSALPLRIVGQSMTNVGLQVTGETTLIGNTSISGSNPLRVGINNNTSVIQTLGGSQFLYRDGDNNTVVGNAGGVGTGFFPGSEKNMIFNGFSTPFATGSNNVLIQGGGDNFISGSNNIFIGNHNGHAGGSGNLLLGSTSYSSGSIFNDKFELGISSIRLFHKQGADPLQIGDDVQITGSLWVNGNKQFNVGAFLSTQTQSGSANVSQSINYNTTDYSQGVSVVSGTRLTVANAGVYNIQFSAQVDRVSGSGTDTVHIWLKKNGTNVTNSAGAITISGGAAAAKTISSWNYVVDAAASDYYEICWQTTDANIQLINAAASGNIPDVPSVIVTVTQVR